MATRINAKFIVILLTAIVAAAGLVGGLWFYRMIGDAARHAALGDENVARGSMYAAMENYARAVRREPGNAEYLRKYEETLLQVQPETSDAARDLYGRLLWIRQHETTHNPTDADAHLRHLKEIHDSARLISMISAPAAQRSFWERLRTAADELLSRVPPTDPDWIYGRLYRGMAVVRLRASMTAEALRQAEEDLVAFVEAKPESDLGWATLIVSSYALADHFRVSGNSREGSRVADLIPERVEKALESVANGPEVARVYMGYLMERWSDGDSDVTFEQVVEAMDRMVDLVEESGDPWLVLEVSDTLQVIGGREAIDRAVRLLESYIDKNPEALAHRYVLALITYRGVSLETAETHANAILDAEPLRVSFVSQMQLILRRLAAALLVDIAYERWQQADAEQKPKFEEQLIADRQRLMTFVTDPENDVQLLRADAKLAMVRGDFDLAASKFERLVREGAADVETLTYAATCLERINQFGLAYERINAALAARRFTSPIMLFYKARIEYRLGRLEDAAETLAQYRERAPDSSLADQLAAAIQSRQDESSNNGSDLTSQTLRAAEDAFNAGDLDTARATIESAIQRAESPDPRLFNAAAHVEMSAGNTDRARTYIEQGLAAAPDNAGLQQMQAWLNTGDLINAAKDYVKSVTTDEGEKAVFLTTYYAALAEQQAETAQRLLERRDAAGAERAQSLSDRARREVESQLALARELVPNDRRLFEFQFNRALAAEDWPQVEQLVERAKSNNIDQTQGLLYEGRYELDRGRTEPAVRIFRRATDLKPFSSQAWRGLGIAYERAGNLREALNAYEQSYRINPNDQNTVRNYLNALVSSGEQHRALRIAQEARRIAPQDTQIREIWLNLEAEVGNLLAALVERRRVYRDVPTDHTNATRLALLLAQNEPQPHLITDENGERRYSDRRWAQLRLNERQEILRNVRAAWDQELNGIVGALEADRGMDLRLAVLKATIHRMRGRIDEGGNTLRQYIESIPVRDQTVEQWLALAQYYIEAGQPWEVIPVIETAAEFQSSDRREADVAMANFLFFQRAYAQALPRFDALAEALDSRQHRARAIECLIQIGRLDEADQRLRAMKESGESDYSIVLLEAALTMGQAEKHFAEGRPEEARSRLDVHRQILAMAERLRPTDPTPHVLRAQSLLTEYRRTGRRLTLDDALTALGRADAVRSNDLQTSLVRAEVLRAGDNIRGAIGELERVLERSPNNVPVRRMLVQLHLEAGSRDAAIGVLRESIEQYPTAAIWHEALGELLQSTGRSDDAADSFLRAYRLSGSASTLKRFLRLRFESQSPDYSSVIAILQERPELLESDDILGAMYAQALHRTGRRHDANSWLRHSYQQFQAAVAAGEKRDADVNEWFEFTGPIFAERQPAEFESIMRELSGGDPSAHELLSVARYHRAYGSEGYPKARELILEAVSKAPENDSQLRGELYFELANTHLAAQDFAGAADAYREVLKFSPDHVLVLNNLGYMLAEYLDSPQEALSYATRAAELSPQNAQILDTLGWVQFRSGNLEEAERTLERSVAIEESPGIYVHLAEVRLALGKRGAAEEALQRASESGPNPATQAEIDRLKDDIRTGASPGA